MVNSKDDVRFIDCRDVCEMRLDEIDPFVCCACAAYDRICTMNFYQRKHSTKNGWIVSW